MNIEAINSVLNKAIVQFQDAEIERIFLEYAQAGTGKHAYRVPAPTKQGMPDLGYKEIQKKMKELEAKARKRWAEVKGRGPIENITDWMDEKELKQYYGLVNQLRDSDTRRGPKAAKERAMAKRAARARAAKKQ